MSRMPPFWRGMAIIGITVMDDGRIARLFVIKSSGDPDIDLRIEMMVSAVGGGSASSGLMRTRLGGRRTLGSPLMKRSGWFS